MTWSSSELAATGNLIYSGGSNNDTGGGELVAYDLSKAKVTWTAQTTYEVLSLGGGPGGKPSGVRPKGCVDSRKGPRTAWSTNNTYAIADDYIANIGVAASASCIAWIEQDADNTGTRIYTMTKRRTAWSTPCATGTDAGGPTPRTAAATGTRGRAPRRRRQSSTRAPSTGQAAARRRTRASLTIRCSPRARRRWDPCGLPSSTPDRSRRR